MATQFRLPWTEGDAGSRHVKLGGWTWSVYTGNGGFWYVYRQGHYVRAMGKFRSRGLAMMAVETLPEEPS